MFSPESYTIIAQIFPRLLGVIFFFAFGAFLFQMRGLLGEHGILPISRYLKNLKTNYPKKCYWYAPTVFWWNSSDRVLLGVVALGTLLSVLLILGLFPCWMLLLLYILYLSIVSAGQDFLGFGWEGYLLEITAHAFFLSLTPVPHQLVWVSLNFLLFRFHFQAGAVKLQTRDKSWCDLTAVGYHYQSQPLPNTMAWYAHKLPAWLHKISCGIMFFIELVVPFGIFSSDEVRLGVFVAFVGLQYMIWVTGNFSFLNHLTVVVSTILLSNAYLGWTGVSAPQITPIPLFLQTMLYLAGAGLLTLQVIRLYTSYFSNPLFKQILYWMGPFHLANRYGIFAVMTTERLEVVLEGSYDGLNWQEYLFKYKPSELTRRPRRIAPYQPRIDWQAWFLPFSEYESEEWFQRFIYHLLKGTPEVVALLRSNPFPEKPPKYIRALMYLYEFSSEEEKKKHGWWWRRSFVAEYTPVLSLKGPASPKQQAFKGDKEW